MTSDTLIRTPWALGHPLLTEYYDTEWGMPVRHEAGVFERLCLESFQSGLSWLTILQKRQAIRQAFHGFSPDLAAQMDEADVERLMLDQSIIRNRRKIESVIVNARATRELRADPSVHDLAELVWRYTPETSPAEHDAQRLPANSPESRALAAELKRRGFTMVGPTTIYALMSAIGMVDLHIVDSHRRGCSGLWNRDGSRVT